MNIYHLPDLQLFVRVAEVGTISAAARQLNLTPAAASAAIQRLERQLQSRLLERSTRSLRLTPEGELFRDYCERALALLQEGETQLRSGRAAVAGTIRVTAPSDLGRVVLAPLLDQFLGLYPQANLVLRVSDSVQDVLREGVDLAIRYGELDSSQLVARKLGDFERMAAASPDYLARQGVPTSPADLLNHNCLTYFQRSKPRTTWTFYSQKKPIEVTVKGDRSSDDSSIVRQWGLAGHGILYKSWLDLEPDLRTGALQRVLGTYAGESLPLHAVHLGGRYLPARVRTLLEFLVERFRDWMQRNPLLAARPDLPQS